MCLGETDGPCFIHPTKKRKLPTISSQKSRKLVVSLSASHFSRGRPRLT
jgi:hypothetical protein